MELHRADILPETKLGAVLERWPALLPTLLGASKRLEALRGPFLLRTFGRAATLRQVAQVAGLAVGRLLGLLRAAAGLPPLAEGSELVVHPARPPWATDAAVVKERDVRGAVLVEVHPLPQVMADLQALHGGEVYAVVTPMVPAPLIDLALTRGLESWSAPAGTGSATRTYFRRA